MSDKTEALLHSRLTAKMLAKENKELEKRLAAAAAVTSHAHTQSEVEEEVFYSS